MSVKQPTRDSRPKTPQHTRGPKIGQKVKGCVFRLQNRMVILQKIKDSHTKNVWKLVNLYFSSKTKNVWYIHDQFIKITKVFRSPSVNRYQNLEVIMSRNNYKNWYFKKYLKNDLVSLKLPTNLMSSPQTFILFIKKTSLVLSSSNMVYFPGEIYESWFVEGNVESPSWSPVSLLTATVAARKSANWSVSYGAMQ